MISSEWDSNVRGHLEHQAALEGVETLETYQSVTLYLHIQSITTRIKRIFLCAIGETVGGRQTRLRSGIMQRVTSDTAAEFV